MDAEKQDLGLSGSWVLIYFAFMGLISIIVGIFIVYLHWRKNLKRERRARQWVDVMRDATFSYSPHLYWINKRRSYGINAAITVGAPPAGSNREISIDIPDFLEDSDTSEDLIDNDLRAEDPSPATLDLSQQPRCHLMPPRRSRSPIASPLFQEIPYASPLRNPPPMLPHSASYPFDIYPKRKAHFYSLPILDDAVNTSNAKPSASEWESPSSEGGSVRYKDY